MSGYTYIKIFLGSLLVFFYAASFGQNPCDDGDDGGSPGCPSGNCAPTPPKVQIPIPLPIARAGDPNEIKGPDGLDTARWVGLTTPLPYKIYFENDPAIANTPAQRVVIYMPIDSSLNMNALRLGDFGFGSFNFNVPPNSAVYSARLDVRDSLGIYVDLVAGLDVINRRAYWIFQSIDPLSGVGVTLPPGTGFLPVNDSITHKGEGYVNLSLLASAKAKTGDTARAQADIVFDTEGVIKTNVWTNLIDARPPISKMNQLKPFVDTVFTIKWSSRDDSLGTGVKSHDIYYSRNKGPFVQYQSSITDTSITFTGDEGATYSFYVIATDSVGNREVKTKGEQTVKIRSGLIKPDLGRDTTVSKCPGEAVNLTTLYPLSGLKAVWNTATPKVQVKPGVYTLMVTDDYGLSDTVNITVNNYPKPDLGKDQAVTYCAGASADITKLYDTGTHVVKWSTSHPESVKKGKYTFIVTSVNGCRDTAVVTVSETPLVVPSASVTASTNNILFGTPVTFTVTVTNGGAAPAYQWMINEMEMQGATQATYQSTSLRNADRVKCRITSNSEAACLMPATVLSDSVTMFVAYPADVIGFEALMEKNEVKTSWEINLETSVVHYNVQRSTDNQTFANIGKVNAKGVAWSKYTFADSKLPDDPALDKLYYRLEIVYNNGKVTYSEVKQVELSNNKDVSLYPNPADAVINVELISKKAATATLNLVNMAGNTIRKTEWQLKVGNNKIKLPVNDLTPGVYILHIDAPEKRSLKFIKN